MSDTEFTKDEIRLARAALIRIHSGLHTLRKIAEETEDPYVMVLMGRMDIGLLKGMTSLREYMGIKWD